MTRNCKIKKDKKKEDDFRHLLNWLRERDLNPRPPGYEPDELPSCSTPRHVLWLTTKYILARLPGFVNPFFKKDFARRRTKFVTFTNWNLEGLLRVQQTGAGWPSALPTRR